VQQRLQPATTSISTTLCHDQQSSVAQASFRMCYQVVERFSSCRCLYYKHAIDPCAAHGQEAHVIEEKTVLVGYACPSHWECEVSGPVQVPYASLTLGNVGLEDTRPAQVPRGSDIANWGIPGHLQYHMTVLNSNSTTMTPRMTQSLIVALPRVPSC
jgi:hypothetical protein